MNNITKTGPTPGPYSATHDPRGDSRLGIHWYIIAPGSQTMIADVNSTERHGLHKPEDAEANARLLAASWDLREALDTLLVFVEHHKAALIGNECTAEQYETNVKPAVKAIRKARGE